ncbi:VOC family protein [Kitasatospora sp. NPDC008115]|uniref:VOC family protein n=1 Tax=Kitasatospora sp. NPDC008115 TaxID=3364022 RepID=UPI0036E95B3A
MDDEQGVTAGLFTAVGRTVVLVEDAEAALAFYRDVLGFTVLFDGDLDGYRLLHVGPSGGPSGGPTGGPGATAGLWLMPAESPDARAAVGRQTGGMPLLVLHTDGLDRVAARLAEHGVPTRPGVADGGPGRSLHFQDLYGNELIAAQL